MIKKDILENLDPSHLAALRASAISDEIISSRGYKTAQSNDELIALGFAPAQCRGRGLLLPLHTVDGGNGLTVYRPDNPRISEDRSKHNPDGTHPCKILKYEFPKGEAMRLDCPPLCQPKLKDPAIELWITEGQKKADSLASYGICSIALLGVWNFKGRNNLGGITFLADWDYIALNEREVRIVFDSDVMVKPEVRQALDRLREHLQRKGAHVTAVYIPGGSSGKIGVDDWLAAGHAIDDLTALIESTRPAPRPAPIVCELLDQPPLTLSRPLALLDDHAYAATWLYTKMTIREEINKRGEIIGHDPPLITYERRLFIIRDDGMIFGEGGFKSMEDLRLNIHLPEIPPDDKLWSTAGVKAYASGNIPRPANVFGKVVDILNRFIDFDHSLADQATMAELLGCYILSTWFLDAFQVVGFIWPNGDRGTGKTHLLLVVSELAYLGVMILAGGSFASLRDMADYGSTLAFDDAEGLSDPKRTDPDKRNLLLAGNRRGAIVTVKELAGDKTWVTRHVNAFCPRLFSATHLPDPILSSRSIVIPLIRTVDRKRANTDPLDLNAWPHNHHQLVDDLWALALAHLQELRKYDNKVGSISRLSGRLLQPWRAILAVAAWLDQNGVSGLWDRIENLSFNYQDERQNLEAVDLTALVIRGICGVYNVCGVTLEGYSLLKTSQITEKVIEIIKADELDIDSEYVNSRRVGKTLSRMRFKKAKEAGSGARCWIISPNEIERWKVAYGIMDVSMEAPQTSKMPQMPGVNLDILEGEL